MLRDLSARHLAREGLVGPSLDLKGQGEKLLLLAAQRYADVTVLSGGTGGVWAASSLIPRSEQNRGKNSPNRVGSEVSQGS